MERDGKKGEVGKKRLQIGEDLGYKKSVIASS